ncbi:ZPR1-related zinc finger protein [Desulfurococcus amylolyticus 1221n]|uniref:ZPR1-related zinc finger protein n=1 Tax=Desulfurococcus amylolyticus (strain DSM 18924 / JCM 16383 / VKM B-2413 / 1221n) TaxID=490899 RepID=B8D303_DESA1|nr:ZPR1 zinc finger domain-containing protein [Desulfurococcus amylolyticus]ACL10550.1 ZPR1-related zinc finger protein [Desulfurococcus amylolyticus 1221n]
MYLDINKPVKFNEYTGKCPVCGGLMVYVDYVYRIPYYESVLITTGECSSCGYKYRDVRLTDQKEPRRIIYRVEKPGDERALVIRSSGSILLIPELGLSIEPGPFSQGFITTVEGLIMDFAEKTRFLCEEDKEKKAECDIVMEKLAKARDGLISYTVIIEDKTGLSDIVSGKTIYEKLQPATG